MKKRYLALLMVGIIAVPATIGLGAETVSEEIVLDAESVVEDGFDDQEISDQSSDGEVYDEFLPEQIETEDVVLDDSDVVEPETDFVVSVESGNDQGFVEGIEPAEGTEAGDYTETKVACPAVGGNIYFDKEKQEITACDKDTVEVAIPSETEGIAVLHIGSKAFAGCTLLRSVIIPASVVSIADDAFADCGLADIYYEGSKEQWSQLISDTASAEMFDTINLHFGDDEELQYSENGVTVTVKKGAVAPGTSVEVLPVEYETPVMFTDFDVPVEQFRVYDISFIETELVGEEAQNAKETQAEQALQEGQEPQVVQAEQELQVMQAGPEEQEPQAVQEEPAEQLEQDEQDLMIADRMSAEDGKMVVEIPIPEHFCENRSDIYRQEADGSWVLTDATESGEVVIFATDMESGRYAICHRRLS